MSTKFMPVRIGGEEDTLLCPNCGGNFLHQEAVRIMNRDSEDKDGMMVEVGTNSEVSIRRIKSADIDGRRDVLRIRFSCEGCIGEKILRIMQHKGTTLIEWL